MKNLISFFSFAVLMTAMCVMSGCKDDDDTDKNIVGAWISHPAPVYDDEDAPIPNELVISYLWYKADGTFVEVDVIFNSETGHVYYELSENGTWSVKGNKVTQTTKFDEDNEDFDIVTCQFKVKGNTLTFSYTEDGETATANLHRITEERMQEILALAKGGSNA